MENNFCYYPFRQLSLNPNGDVAPCCWNPTYLLGNVQKKTLIEIWNDEPIKALRREFLQNNPVSCRNQIKYIGCQIFSQHLYSSLSECSDFQKNPPARLDLFLNGKCNLRCVMCDVWSQPNGIYDQSDFWTEWADAVFPYLKEIEVLGGEPFIQQDTYRLIDAVSKVNKKCKWSFVTNGHYSFNTKIQQYLEKIAINRLQLSLDSVNPDTYHAIRTNGNLTIPLETLERIRQFHSTYLFEGKKFTLCASMCVIQRNWHEIDEFLTYMKSREIIPILQLAFFPSEVALLSFPREMQYKVLAYLESMVQKWGEYIIEPIIVPLKEALNANKG